MSPVYMSAAILLGVVIGWVLSTIIHDYAWGKLYKLQLKTLALQKETSQTQDEYTARLKETIQMQQELRAEWTKVTAEFQSAVETNERAKAELQTAIQLREKAQRDTRSVSC